MQIRQIGKQTILGQEIVLTNDVINYLGPDLTLENCRVVLQCVGSGLHINQTKLINCQIDVRRKLVNFKWVDAWIQNCTFNGTMNGNDFGHWPPFYSEMGGIQDCDFSEAILSFCRFIDCPLEKISLPKWPCFTIVDPGQNQPKFETVISPVDLSFFATPLLIPKENVVAVTYFASSLLKKRRLDNTEEDLRAVLSPLDFVLL